MSMATVAGTCMMTTMLFVAAVQAMMLPPTTPLVWYIQKGSENLLVADHRRVSDPHHHTKRLSRAA